MESHSTKPPFFASPPGKVLLLSVATVGVFQYVWVYRCWRHVGQVLGHSLGPVAQLVFYPWSLLFYLRRLRVASGHPSWPAIVPMFLWWVASVLFTFHPRWGPLGFVALALPLVLSQRWAAAANVASGAKAFSDHWRPTRGELLFLVLVVPIAALIYAAVLSPAPFIEGAG